MSVRVTMCLMVLSSVLGLSRAYADYQCEKGYHDITSGELALITGVLEATRAAVPPPPGGWINVLDDDSVSPPQSFCLDFHPWTYSYTRHYARVEGAEERQRVIAAAREDLRVAMEAKQPQLDALQAEITQLSTQLVEAMTNGDNTRVQTLKLEIERTQEEYGRIMNEGDPSKAFEAAMASQYTDLEMNVSVTVNSVRESPDDGAQPFDVPGAASAFQWISSDDGQQGSALILFGEWQPSTSGYGLDTAIPAGVAPEQPHTISIRINAHKDRLPSVIGAMDFDAFAALLAH